MMQFLPMLGFKTCKWRVISHFTKINEISCQRDPISCMISLFFAYKQSFNWNVSGILETCSWESTLLTMSCNTRDCCYLQLWHGIIGGMVCASQLSKALQVTVFQGYLLPGCWRPMGPRQPSNIL